VGGIDKTMDVKDNIRVLFVMSDTATEFNCAQYRCVSPYRSLRSAGYDADLIFIEDWAHRTKEAVKATESADLIFFQRNAFGQSLETLLYWTAKGKKIVIDLDDGYEFMTADTGSPSYMFWVRGVIKDKDGKENDVKPRPLDTLRWYAKLVGNVSSPSSVICDDWKSLVKTHLVPNYLDGNLYHNYDVYREPGKLYIGWGGSATHLNSWIKSGASEALWEITKEFKNVNVLLGGDDRVLSHVKVPDARRIKLGWVNMALWPMNLSRFDIGLAPLSGAYDDRRSSLKVIEYLIMGIPSIVSNALPYQAFGDVTTLVNNDPTSWYKAIKDCIINYPDRKRQAEINVAKGLEWDVYRNADNLMNIYTDIYNGR
jgi:hypothetical protein